MKSFLTFVFKVLPFGFGIGFIAPLIGQTLPMFGIETILGLSPILVGLVIGGTWGALATKTGRWI